MRPVRFEFVCSAHFPRTKLSRLRYDKVQRLAGHFIVSLSIRESIESSPFLCRNQARSFSFAKVHCNFRVIALGECWITAVPQREPSVSGQRGTPQELI